MIAWMRSLGILVALLIISTQSSHAASAGKFHNIIIFGDSLSDAGDTKNEKQDYSGNNDWFIIEGKDDVVAPAGAPITSSPDKNPKGPRPLWINMLIEQLDLANGSNRLYNYRHLKNPDYKNIKLNPKHHNISYAWVSAETGDAYIDDSDAESLYPFANSECKKPGIIVANHTACVPGLLKQVDLYLSDVGNKPNPDTLFIIWVGNNDILNNMAKLMSDFLDLDEFVDAIEEVRPPLLDALTANPKTNPELALSTPVSNMVKATQVLQKNGVPRENIYVINLPNLAQTPAGTYLSDGNKTILELINTAVTQYNDNLSASLIKDNALILADNLISGQEIFTDIISKPSKHKLKNAKTDCIDDGKGPVCAGYVFFKDKNPTIFTGKIIADAIAQTLTNNQHG